MKGRGINNGRGNIIDFLRFHLRLIIKIQAEDSEQGRERYHTGKEFKGDIR
jgi:hypothetical protein